MLNLTTQERKAVLFLLGTALAGILINFSVKSYPCIKEAVEIDERIFKVDINKVTYEDLLRMQRVPAKFAKSIIEYRQDKGLFRRIEELKEIKGVSVCRYEKLKEIFFVE